LGRLGRPNLRPGWHIYSKVWGGSLIYSIGRKVKVNSFPNKEGPIYSGALLGNCGETFLGSLFSFPKNI